MAWKSQDYVNTGLQFRQLEEQKRIADEMAKQNAAMQKQTAAIQQQMEMIQRQQREQQTAQEIEHKIDLLVDQEEAPAKLKAISHMANEVISETPESGRETETIIAKRDALSKSPEYVSSVMSVLTDIESATQSLGIVTISSITRQKLDDLKRIAVVASKLLGLIAEIQTFQGYLDQHPLSEINKAKNRITDYVDSGSAERSNEELSTAIALMKECIATAKQLLEKSDCYKTDRVPPVFRNLRKTASEITTQGNSFWKGQPSSEQLSLIEHSLALSDYLTSSHEALETACQTITEFNSRHDEKHPVDVRKIPAPITEARNKITEIAKELDERTTDANTWPQAACFTKTIQRANQYREVAKEVQQAYEALPKNTVSGLAVFSFVLGVLSIFGSFFTAIPAIITGHMALKRMRWHRGKGLAIAGLVLGYLMTVIGTITLIESHKSKNTVLENSDLTDSQSVPKTTVDAAQKNQPVSSGKAEGKESAADAANIRRREAELGAQAFARCTVDTNAEAEAFEHLKKAVGETVLGKSNLTLMEKENITDWEGKARFELAAIYFQKSDIDHARRLINAIFDNACGNWEEPPETASSFRLLMARISETEGKAVKACESYCNYFRPKLEHKTLTAEDRKTFVHAWKLALANITEMNIDSFCCVTTAASKGHRNVVGGILATEDEATIVQIRDMLANAKMVYYVKEIDEALGRH